MKLNSVRCNNHVHVHVHAHVLHCTRLCQCTCKYSIHVNVHVTDHSFPYSDLSLTYSAPAASVIAIGPGQHTVTIHAGTQRVQCSSHNDVPCPIA